MCVGPCFHPRLCFQPAFRRDPPALLEDMMLLGDGLFREDHEARALSPGWRHLGRLTPLQWPQGRGCLVPEAFAGHPRTKIIALALVAQWPQSKSEPERPWRLTA